MAELSIANLSDLFIEQFGPGSFNTYDTSFPLTALSKKTFGWVGKNFTDYVPLSQGGGVGTNSGSGIIPQANNWLADQMTITPIESLSVVKIARDAIYAGKGDGSFKESMPEIVRRGVLNFARNAERQLMGNGDGELGIIDTGGVTDNGGGEYEVVITAASFLEAKWEEGDYVNVESGSTDLFEVTAVVSSTRTVTLQRIAGSQVPADADEIFMQGSEGNDSFGLEQCILNFTSGSLYGIPYQRRWSSELKDANGAVLSVELLDEIFQKIHTKTGEAPDAVLVSPTQWRLLKSVFEGLKRYEQTRVMPRFSEPKKQADLMRRAESGALQLGFEAITYTSPFGSAPIISSRWVKNDTAYVLNRNFIKIMHRDGFGWHKEDNTVFLREAGKTNYEARYGGNMNASIIPTFHGAIYDLATS